jgi:hypothetical protein
VWHTPCYVLLSWDLSNHAFWAVLFGIFRKLLMSRVHWLDLRLLGGMVQRLLINEPFSQWKLIRIETENCIWIKGRSWYCWQALRESIEFISQLSELKCERYGFFSRFCSWKFKQITKIGFARKNQLSQCVHTWANSTGYIIMYKNKLRNKSQVPNFLWLVTSQDNSIANMHVTHL